MPSLRDLDVVHRLNAPTRAAATRRRRLRKTCACLCIVGAALVATGGGSKDAPASTASNATQTTSWADRADLRGRHLVAIKADGAIVDRVSETARVDVWAADGTRLASNAPIVPPSPGSSRRVDTSVRAEGEQILVALTPGDVLNIARHDNAGRASWSGLFVTVRP